MTTRKRTTKAAKAKTAQETTTEPNAGKGAQALEAGQAQEPDTQPGQGAKEPEEKDTAKEPAAKDGAPNTGEAVIPAASQEGAKINTPSQAREIPALFIRTKRRFKSRRRAGFRFTREGHGIALEALSEEQIAALHADPALEVEECTVPAEADEAEG